MAKFLISYLLLATFLLNLLDVGLLILRFELNRDTFAELCINKDKEELHCNGHCQLEKQFREYETEQPSEKEKAVPQKENSPFLCSCFPFINWNNFITNTIPHLFGGPKTEPGLLRYFSSPERVEKTYNNLHSVTIFAVTQCLVPGTQLFQLHILLDSG